MDIKFQEIAVLESALQEQREISESLRDAQGKVSAYEAELEAQLKERDAEAKQQKEELERLKQLSQVRTELYFCQRCYLPQNTSSPTSHHITNNCWLGVPSHGRWYQFAGI